jgi:hypothetical protein
VTDAEKTDNDLERLLAAWKSATPEARRIFAEVHFAMDGWPSAQPIFSDDEAMDGAKSSRKK